MAFGPSVLIALEVQACHESILSCLQAQLGQNASPVIIRSMRAVVRKAQGFGGGFRALWL